MAWPGLWEEVILAEGWWGAGLSIFGDPRVREECLGSFEGGEEGASGGFTGGGEEEVGRDEELYRCKYRHHYRSHFHFIRLTYLKPNLTYIPA